MKKRVTFFGWSEAKPESKIFKDAFETARMLGEKGVEIVNGGGPGVMLASTLGARAGGGRVITATFNPQNMDFFEARDPKNVADENFEMGSYEDRTEKLIELGDAYIIFNGGTGTISELGMVWGLARLHFRKHKPLIFFGSFWHEVLEGIGAHMKLREEELRVYYIVDEAAEAVKEVLAKRL